MPSKKVAQTIEEILTAVAVIPLHRSRNSFDKNAVIFNETHRVQLVACCNAGRVVRDLRAHAHVIRKGTWIKRIMRQLEWSDALF